MAWGDHAMHRSFCLRGFLRGGKKKAPETMLAMAPGVCLGVNRQPVGGDGRQRQARCLGGQTEGRGRVLKNSFRVNETSASQPMNPFVSSSAHTYRICPYS